MITGKPKPMNKRARQLMQHALARYARFHAGNPLSRAWIGLGTESVYRPAIEAGLMTWHDGQLPPKRCMGWLILTKKGESEFLKMAAEIIREKME